MKIPITCKGSDYIPLNHLKKFQGNLKTLSKDELEKLKRSILKHGFSFPVFLWNNNILDGHQRVYAVKQLLKEGYNIDAIPVVEIEAQNKTEAAEKLLLINSRYAKITDDGLYEFLASNELDLNSLAGDLSLPDLDLERFLNDHFKAENETFTDEDEVPDVKDDPITQPGDIYLLEQHRVLCGDSTKASDVNLLMDGHKADMCFTSPPYNVGRTPNGKDGTVNESKYQRSNDNLSILEYVDFLVAFISNALTIGDNVFCNIQSVAGNKLALIEFLYRLKDKYADTIIWDKMIAEPAMGRNILNSQFEYIHIFSHKANRVVGSKPFRGTISNIYRFNSRQDKAYSDIHKATFPVAFAEHFVANFSEESVYEPFGGTGSTLIACEKANRKCYLMEIDPYYCDVIVKRWEQYTGKKALLERTQ